MELICAVKQAPGSWLLRWLISIVLYSLYCSLSGKIRYGTVWYGMVRYRTAGLIVNLYGTVRYGTCTVENLICSYRVRLLVTQTIV